MKYKLLVVDIDGTLVGREGTVSAKDRKALAQASNAGIKVALSTGRVPSASLNIINNLSLDGVHIFCDGALVSNPAQSQEVYVQPLDKAIVREAIEFAHANDIYLELYSATHYFVEQETWATEIHHQFFDLEPTVVNFAKLWKRERIIKAELMTSTPQEAAKARSFYIQFDGRLHFSRVRTPAYPGVEFINIVDLEVSKGKALEALVSHLGVSISEVMAVGDGVNDIPLLSAAGLAVAMDNAPAEVKTAAHYITLDVDRSGLATAIKKFLL